jgi:hypothetical protein
MLTISGEKHEERQEQEKDKNYHYSERRFGSFRRTIQLPQHIDRDKIAANFRNGVLNVTLPKSHDARQRQRKIEDKGSKRGRTKRLGGAEPDSRRGRSAPRKAIGGPRSRRSRRCGVDYLPLRRRIAPKPSNALPSRTRLAGSGTWGGVLAEASMTPVRSDGENTSIAKY